MCFSPWFFFLIFFFLLAVWKQWSGQRGEEREKAIVFFFPVIKSWRGDDVKAVCVPEEVFMALQESRWALLVAEIMEACRMQQAILMVPTRYRSSQNKYTQYFPITFQTVSFTYSPVKAWPVVNENTICWNLWRSLIWVYVLKYF